MKNTLKRALAMGVALTLVVAPVVKANEVDPVKEAEKKYEDAWDQFEKELSKDNKEEKKEEKKENEKVLDNQEDDRWGDWAKEQEKKEKEEKEKEKREEELSKTTKPEDASSRVEKPKMTDDTAKNEKEWADKSEQLYKAYRIEDQTKYAMQKLAASKEYQKALAKYKAALAREDHWDAAATKALILDMILKEFPNADTYNAEDFASDYLELTAAANTETLNNNVPEVDKYGNTDKNKVGEEGTTPDATTPGTETETGSEDKGTQTGSEDKGTKTGSKDKGTQTGLVENAKGGAPKTADAGIAMSVISFALAGGATLLADKKKRK